MAEPWKNEYPTCDDLPDNHFGYCPRCRAEPTYLDVHKDNWCACLGCKVRWHVGWNLFSSWRHQTERQEIEARTILMECEDVDPLHGTPQPAAHDGGDLPF